MHRRVEIVALLLCLLSGPTSSTNMGVRRRWRALEGYYNFDEDGDGFEGNPADMPSTDDVLGNEKDAKGSKAHKAIANSPSVSPKESNGLGGKDKSTAGGSGTYNGGGSDKSGGSSGSYSSASSSYSSASGSYSGASSPYSGASGSYSGASSPYSGASSPYSGASSPYSGASGSYSGASGSYSGDDVGSYHSPSKLSLDFESLLKKVNVDVPLVPAIIVASIFMCCGMLCTAFMYQARSESTFTNCCRLVIHCIRSACAIAYNLYRCRLGNIPPIVCAMEDADDLDDEELERMKPRPGIEKALHIEHEKALSRVELASNTANKTSQDLMAKIFG